MILICANVYNIEKPPLKYIQFVKNAIVEWDGKKMFNEKYSSFESAINAQN